MFLLMFVFNSFVVSLGIKGDERMDKFDSAMLASLKYATI